MIETLEELDYIQVYSAIYRLIKRLLIAEIGQICTNYTEVINTMEMSLNQLASFILNDF